MGVIPEVYPVHEAVTTRRMSGSGRDLCPGQAVTAHRASREWTATGEAGDVDDCIARLVSTESSCDQSDR